MSQKQCAQQREIDAAHEPVADAGDQRQRYGVGDIGADDAYRRQAWVEEEEGGDAERAGADRRYRHQHAEDGADGDGDRGLVTVQERGFVRLRVAQDALAEEIAQAVGAARCRARSK